MSACCQSAFGMVPAKSASMKKGQKRFVVGQRVAINCFEGFTVRRIGTIKVVGKSDLFVQFDGRAFPQIFPRYAVVQEKGVK